MSYLDQKPPTPPKKKKVWPSLQLTGILKDNWSFDLLSTLDLLRPYITKRFQFVSQAKEPITL